MAVSLLLVILGFNAVFLWPEVGVTTYYFDDDAVHLLVTRVASSVLSEGLNPTDFWLTQTDLGLPLFHYYQNLPHIILAVLDQVTHLLLPIGRLFDLTRYLLLVLFPLSIFIAMRRLEFDYLAAGFSAVIASLLQTFGLYGFNYGSYVWWGFGMYTQLWVMVLLPLALAEIYRTIRKGSPWFPAVLLTAMVLLSHLLYGMILIVSAAFIIFLSPTRAEILSRFKRWAVVFSLTALVTGYFYLPILLDRAYLNRTIWLSAFKYDSFGASVVLTNLFSGNLLDYGRVPILTALFLIAVLFVALQWKQENCRFVLVLTLFWLLAYFGRPTWGSLLDLIPFSRDILFHRLIGGFHLGVILVTGAGLSLLWQWAKKFPFPRPYLRSPLVIGMIFLLVLTPAFLEHASFYGENAREKTRTRDAFLQKSGDISGIQEALQGLPPGRVYAGIPGDFGDYPYYLIGSVSLYHLLPQLGLDTFGHEYGGMGLSDDIRMWFNNTKQEQYNLFNIRYVILHNTWTPAYYYTKVREFDTYTLYQVPTTGYFDLVDAPAVFYGSSDDFYTPNARWLWSALPKQKEHPVLVFGDSPGDTRGLPVYTFKEVDYPILASLSREQPARGEITGEEVGTNEYRARFVADRDCYLMLKTNFHPGWKVTLDGREVSPVMLAPGYIGIPVAPGSHEAVFTYYPPSYRLPLMVGSLLLLLLLGLLEWAYSRGMLDEQAAGVQTVFGRFGAWVKRALGSMDPQLKNLVSLAIIWKLSLFLVLVLAWFSFPFNLHLYTVNHVLPENASFFTIFKTWDAQHYLFIAENGYPTRLTTTGAFYPLYPFIIRIAGFFFLGNNLLAALIISNIFSILSLVFFYLLVRKLFDDTIAFIAGLCMLSFTTFFYTSLVYSEALFLFLVTVFFYYLYEERFYPCLITSLLLPLTRPTGILVILPFLAYLGIEAWKSKQVRITKKYLLIPGFIAGFLLYLGVMYYLTGSFFWGFEAQKLFIAGNSIGNLLDPLSWVQRNFLQIQFTLNGYTTGILDRICFAIFLVLLYFIYKYLDFTLFVYSVALGVIPALTGNMMSYMRFLSVVFPMYIVLALKFRKNPYVLIIPLSVLQVLFFVEQGLNYWVA